MRALTLIRPWPWAIFHAGKDVENRSWAPRASQLLPGNLLAIHAGAKWDRYDAEWIDRLLKEVAGTVPRTMPAQSDHVSGIIGVVRFMGVTIECESPWFSGPVGWRIAEPRLLPEPIPCRGALGLWALPPDVEASVRRQLGLS